MFGSVLNPDPETVIALCDTFGALYDVHAFVFVCCLRFVVRLRLAVLWLGVCAALPLSVPGILMPFVESAAGSDSNNAAGSRSEPDSFRSTSTCMHIPLGLGGRGGHRLKRGCFLALEARGR